LRKIEQGVYLKGRNIVNRQQVLAFEEQGALR
jgi:hypothetical protein